MSAQYLAPGNRTITSIDSKTPVLGAAVAAQSVPVVIASDQTLLVIWPDGQVALMRDAPYAQKVTVAGVVTYVAIAAVGTLQAAALWQAKRITVAGADTLIAFADGNANFDNVATNLALLAYA